VPTEGRSTSLPRTLARVCCSGVADGLEDSEFQAARRQVFHKPRLQLFVLAVVQSANLPVLRYVPAAETCQRRSSRSGVFMREIFDPGELVNWAAKQSSSKRYWNLRTVLRKGAATELTALVGLRRPLGDSIPVRY
jgi:hypothetical protein